MTRNGIFGLFSLDGAALDARDRHIVLGDLAEAALAVPGALVATRDLAGGGIHRHCDEGGLAVLLGDLDEPVALAARLGLPRDANPAALAAAAFARWGRNAPPELAGEWLLLRWHAAGATLTMLMAEGAYETCLVATDGRRVAVAPDLVRLARLPWVDAGFDPDMLMRAMGRGHLRASMRERSILTGVRRVRAGACVTIDRHGIRVEAPDPRVPPGLRHIAFDDAVAELDALLRRIMRGRLARGGDIAVQLSGGLDSSLMALLAADERRPGQRIVCLTSAAPPGSGLEDESDWAALVARHLDVPMIAVTPAADADVYRPSARTLAAAQSPALSPRHYLYEALGDAAVAAGARLLADGSFGELTISNHGGCLAAQQRVTPRGMARDWRDRWRSRMAPTRTEDYHVMPARDAVAAVAGLRALRPRTYAPRRVAADAPFGFEDGVATIGQLPTFVGDARLRTLLPLRDPRLILLMASFPAGLVRHGGIDRAPIRALLGGRLPDQVATRPKGLAFSPTYQTLLRAQAGAAIARLPDQQQAGAADWLDLAWLDRMLRRVRNGERLPLETLTRVQGTAYAAEFFSWWRLALRGDA